MHVDNSSIVLTGHYAPFFIGYLDVIISTISL